MLWLDARTAEAYEADHMPGALLLNEDDWEALIEPVFMAWEPGPPEMRVVNYCDGRACQSVAENLREETGGMCKFSTAAGRCCPGRPINAMVAGLAEDRDRRRLHLGGRA